MTPSAIPPPAILEDWDGAQDLSRPPAGSSFRRWSFPLTVKAIILDLDGTLMPSYKMLAAIHHLGEELRLSPEATETFISRYLKAIAFEDLLHLPKQTLRAADQFINEQRIVLTPAARRKITAIQEESFSLYKGVRELLHRAQTAGAFVGIYTNSPDFFAVKRLSSALVDANDNGIRALWAKQHAVQAPPSRFNEASTAAEKSFCEILIPCGFQKPDATPMRDVMRLGNIKPEEVLMIGEGSGDLESVYRDPAAPAGIFCFQAFGARDICDRQRAVNMWLRPGVNPLGYRAVNQRIHDRGLNEDIIRFEDGFLEPLRLMDSRDIILSAPDIMPYVRDHRLTVDAPFMPRIGIPAGGAQALRAKL